ncbi:GNAT family N-acetyltransferase [Halomarina ordinaria]|uniref:GNAT family N-acetyltransferase n=1 Tax=Halomarina ordinaria TaxID=3033939 RepID=A0ABD5U8X8_9EURY|nr:GNAT family N-acetyltransferase [Halomarina sp. PSRA2]
MDLVEAGPADVETLVDLWFSLATEMERYSRFNELSYSSRDDVSGDGFRELLASEDVRVVLIRDEATVGYLVLREGTHPSRTCAEYVRLVDLLVREEYRDRGYGSAAVEAVKVMAREEGYDLLKVACEWRNEGARRFYRGHDFEPKQVEFVHDLA